MRRMGVLEAQQRLAALPGRIAVCFATRSEACMLYVDPQNTAVAV
jgi:hypothetical protein